MSNSELVNQSVRLYQGLHKRHFSADDLFRIYLGTSVSHLFVRDNTSRCDTGIGYCLKPQKNVCI